MARYGFLYMKKCTRGIYYYEKIISKSKKSFIVRYHRF